MGSRYGFWYGKPIEELSRKELIAALYESSAMHRTQIELREQEREFMEQDDILPWLVRTGKLSVDDIPDTIVPRQTPFMNRLEQEAKDAAEQAPE